MRHALLVVCCGIACSGLAARTVFDLPKKFAHKKSFVDPTGYRELIESWRADVSPAVGGHPGRRPVVMVARDARPLPATTPAFLAR